jgi:hypothetical protein
MKVIVESEKEAINVCCELQDIINQISTSNLHNIEKTSFSIFLSEIRDAVEVSKE